MNLSQMILQLMSYINCNLLLTLTAYILRVQAKWFPVRPLQTHCWHRLVNFTRCRPCSLFPQAVVSEFITRIHSCGLAQRRHSVRRRAYIFPRGWTPRPPKHLITQQKYICKGSKLRSQLQQFLLENSRMNRSGHLHNVKYWVHLLRKDT